MSRQKILESLDSHDPWTVKMAIELLAHIQSPEATQIIADKFERIDERSSDKASLQVDCINALVEHQTRLAFDKLVHIFDTHPGTYFYRSYASKASTYCHSLQWAQYWYDRLKPKLTAPFIGLDDDEISLMQHYVKAYPFLFQEEHLYQFLQNYQTHTIWRIGPALIQRKAYALIPTLFDLSLPNDNSLFLLATMDYIRTGIVLIDLFFQENGINAAHDPEIHKLIKVKNDSSRFIAPKIKWLLQQEHFPLFDLRLQNLDPSYNSVWENNHHNSIEPPTHYEDPKKSRQEILAQLSTADLSKNTSLINELAEFHDADDLAFFEDLLSSTYPGCSFAAAVILMKWDPDLYGDRIFELYWIIREFQVYQDLKKLLAPWAWGRV